MTWLEFETNSGRIVCEVKSGGTPSVMEGHDVIPTPEDWDGDILGWTVKDGTAVRTRPVDPEPQEFELANPGQGRIKDLMNEFTVALLDGDAKKTAALREEFRRMKATV